MTVRPLVPVSATPLADSPRAERFEALVEGYGCLVAQAVRRVAAPDATNDLEDIQQDVMLAMWKRLSAEQPIEYPTSYLYRAAIREAVRAVGRLRRRAEASLADFEPASPRVHEDGEAAIVRREQQEMLERALGALGPERARAVRGYLAGLSVEEMMHLHGWTYQRGRNLVARGVRDLKLAVMVRAQS